MSQTGFICLYDYNWNPLGKWTQHVAKSWSLRRKAFEQDEFEAQCQGFENSKTACFVGLHTKTGQLKYAAFCGIPSTKNGITSITGVDCRNLFNQEAWVDYTKRETGGQYKIRTVSALFEYLMDTVLEENGINVQVDYELDLDDLDFLIGEWKEEYITRTAQVMNIWTQLMAACHCYNVFIETSFEVTDENKYKLIFTVKRTINSRPIKLSDYDVVMKLSQNVVNRVIYAAESAPTNRGYYYLNNDNTITATLVSGKACFPPVTEMILGETKAEAQAEAYQTLAKNRYKDKVTINLKTKLGSTLEDLDFTYFGVLKGYNPADQSSEKTLPVCQISEDHEGNKSLVFGRLSDYWFMD